MWVPCSVSRGFLQGEGCRLISQRQQDEKGPVWRAWGGLGVTSYQVSVLLPRGGRGRTLVGPVGLLSRSMRTSKFLRPKGAWGVDCWCLNTGVLSDGALGGIKQRPRRPAHHLQTHDICEATGIHNT